jgi:hypothetical protein
MCALRREEEPGEEKGSGKNGINLKPIPSICDEWASTWLARIHIQGLKLMPFGSGKNGINLGRILFT